MSYKLPPETPSVFHEPEEPPNVEIDLTDPQVDFLLPYIQQVLGGKAALGVVNSFVNQVVRGMGYPEGTLVAYNMLEPKKIRIAQAPQEEPNGRVM